MNTYLAGNLIRVATYTGSTASPQGGFRDENGTLADPGVVTLTWRPGTGQPVQTAAWPSAPGPIVHDGTGLFHADLDTSIALVTAPWTYRWAGTGTVQAVAASIFNVSVALI